MTTDHDPVALLSTLVSMQSVNRAYPAENGEHLIGNFVAAWLAEAGFEVSRQEVRGQDPNVIAMISAPNTTATLVFEAHMDTVSAPDPGMFEPMVTGDAVYGRGSCDTKGSLAAMMIAGARLANQRDALTSNICLVAAVDEEHGAAGINALAESDLEISAAIIGEPTDLRIVYTHKGVLRGRISIHGTAAHTANPHLGLSAIEGAADVIASFRSLRAQFAERAHPALGMPSFTIGLIEGGTAVNIVPEYCAIEWDRRVLPGETRESALAEIDFLLDDVRALHPGLRIERDEPRMWSPPLETDLTTDIVSCAGAAARRMNLPDAPEAVPYGTDASILQVARGIPAIVLGPGSISVAHTDNEFVPIREVKLACDLYERIGRTFGKEAT